MVCSQLLQVLGLKSMKHRTNLTNMSTCVVSKSHCYATCPVQDITNTPHGNAVKALLSNCISSKAYAAVCFCCLLEWHAWLDWTCSQSVCCSCFLSYYSQRHGRLAQFTVYAVLLELLTHHHAERVIDTYYLTAG